MARGVKKAAVEKGPVEGPWELPEGWHWERLGALADFVNGAAFKPTDWHEDGVPIIRIQNLTNPLRAPNRTRRQVDEKFRVREGDILVSWSATLDVFTWRGEDAWLNQHIFKVANIREGLEKRYLLHLLKSEVDALRRSEHLHGSTMLHINRGPFLAHPVPVPDLATQCRIADCIDELFAEISDGERTIAVAAEGVGSYRKALLKAAVTGDLTADWRSTSRIEETGAQLLDRVLRLRREDHLSGNPRRGASYRGPQGTLSADLPRLPSSWAWATLEQLSSLITSGSRGWADYYSAEGPIFIRAANLNRDCLDLTDVAHVSPPRGAEGSRTSVQAGDVLVTITGANVTKAGRVEAELGEAYVSQHVGLIRPVLPELSDYLYRWVIAYGGGRGYLEAAAYGAGKPGLSLENLRAMPVALPPLAEIGTMLTRADELADAVADFRQPDLSLLRQSILAAAFRGDLVA